VFDAAGRQLAAYRGFLVIGINHPPTDLLDCAITADTQLAQRIQSADVDAWRVRLVPLGHESVPFTFALLNDARVTISQ
jgi:hypothetical protein